MAEQIEHVSDTALLVAACRALESERADGLIRDPFASRLAGHRGMAIVNNGTVPQWMELAIGLRTRFLDDLIGKAIAEGADGVLSLGAGLDARPWRLSLPGALPWTEVDFSEILDYKYNLLTDETPACKLERRSADLNERSERRRVLSDACAGANQPLLLTEGLLMYLPSETVRALATEAREFGFQFWLMDSSSPALMRRAHGESMQHIERVRAETHLEGPQIRSLVEQNGWTPSDRRLFVEEGPKLAGARIREIVRSEASTAEPPPNDGSGVWLYQSEI